MDSDEFSGAERADERVVPVGLAIAASWSWRLLVVGAATIAGLALLDRLRLVLIPVAVALLLAVVLNRPTSALAARGVPRAVAATLCVIGFMGGLGAVLFVIARPLVSQMEQFGSTLGVAADDVERWLVDGPLGLEAEQIDTARSQLSAAFKGAWDGGILVDGAVLVGEILAGSVLAVVMSFFIVKDGPLLQTWVVGLFPQPQHDRVRRVGGAAWSSLERFLMGAAALGAVESGVMGLTLLVVGADVIAPVVGLTFVAAFVPFVGAAVAGVVAVMVTLASVGIGPAVVVAIVALLVQQFDNDLLAPAIYGRALRLHPLAVILSVAVGATVGGIVGAFLAVPVVAVGVSAFHAARDEPPDSSPS